MLRSAHLRDRDLLLAVDGEGSRRRQAAVNRHVEQCAACRERLERMSATLSAASTLFASDIEQAPPASRTARVRLERALGQAADEWHPSLFQRLCRALEPSPAAAACGVAALLVLVAVTWMSGPEMHAGATIHGAPAALPIATLTPGAVSSLTAVELCAGRRPSRLVTEDSRRRVVRDYGMEAVPAGSYELDALITPELGGTTEPGNLWPQRYESPVWNARVKDELEDLLPALVCSHRLDLAQAQRDIATDWVAAYKQYFRTDTPLQAHVGSPIAADSDHDDHGDHDVYDDLEFAPVSYAAAEWSSRLPGIGFMRPER